MKRTYLPTTNSLAVQKRVKKRAINDITKWNGISFVLVLNANPKTSIFGRLTPAN